MKKKSEMLNIDRQYLMIFNLIFNEGNSKNCN